MKKLAHCLAAFLRLIVIVAISVGVGVAFAVVGHYANGDALEIAALFATFVAPVTVAWLLLRLMPPMSGNSTGARFFPVQHNKGSRDASAPPQPQDRSPLCSPGPWSMMKQGTKMG